MEKCHASAQLEAYGGTHKILGFKKKQKEKKAEVNAGSHYTPLPPPPKKKKKKKNLKRVEECTVEWNGTTNQRRFWMVMGKGVADATTCSKNTW